MGRKTEKQTCGNVTCPEMVSDFEAVLGKDNAYCSEYCRDVNEYTAESFEILTSARAMSKAYTTVRKVFLDQGALPRYSVGDFYYLPSLGLWSRFDKRHSLGNIYGLGDPHLDNDVICDLTVPLEGVNRSIGAVYARAKDTGEIGILHRGNIGGGVSKGVFWEHFREYGGRSVELNDGGRNPFVALVATIGGPTFLNDVKTFVVTVKAIRERAGRKLRHRLRRKR